MATDSRHLLAPVGERVLIARLIAAQGNACALCGKPMRLDRNCRAADAASIDHVVPRAKGGRHQLNRVLAHRRCNIAKADHPPSPSELDLLAIVNAKLS